MLLIINPAAGTRKAKRQLTDMIEVFNREGYEVQVFVTGGRGDAQAEAARLAEQVDMIVCCGGDGTFNETVSGILQAGCQTPIGYIPAGSTNDFANSLKLNTNCMKAVKAIAAGSVCHYDAGRFDDRYFAYVASFGAFSRTSYSTSQAAKNALGHVAYLMESMQELPRIKGVHVKLELDKDTVEDDFLFGAVCNSTSLGGVLSLDPKQVDMSDGKFEVLLVRKPKDFSEITECMQAVQKQQYNCRMLTFRKASRIRVFTDAPLDWSLDGEKASMDTQMLIENLHGAIALVK